MEKNQLKERVFNFLKDSKLIDLLPHDVQAEITHAIHLQLDIEPIMSSLTLCRKLYITNNNSKRMVEIVGFKKRYTVLVNPAISGHISPLRNQVQGGLRC